MNTQSRLTHVRLLRTFLLRTALFRTVLLTACTYGLTAAWFAPGAYADRCDLGAQPAATLLLPYFEVDLENPQGIDTIFSINNAWQEPALARITLWTDYGIPTVGFDVFLTGYDTQAISLRRFFVDGVLPITAPEEFDPDDVISPGDGPGDDGNFPDCAGILPLPLEISPALIDEFQRNHSGRPSAFSPGTETCSSFNHGDGLARGYVTVDNVNRCSLGHPTDEGYFINGGLGVANNKNQLWGDFYLVDEQENFAQGDNLVHIEAFGHGWEDGDATFYGRYIDGTADNREPLASVSSTRYLNGGPFDATQLLVWRETGSADIEPPACEESPEWYPLYQRQIIAYSESNEGYELCAPFICPVCLPSPGFPCLPLAAQRTSLVDVLEPPFHFGRMYLDLNISNEFQSTTVPAQSWVVGLTSAQGRYSVGVSSMMLHSACDEPPEFRLGLPNF